MQARVRSVAFVLSSFFAATGCGAGAGPGESTGESNSAITEKCGASASSSEQGVDVSHYQGNFDFAASHAKFAYASVGDGSGFIDPDFSTNWAHMKSAGVLRGAYQFFEPAESASAQADIMVKTVGKLGPGDLPCVIDVEVTGGENGGTIASRVKTWLDIVEAGTGKKPIIYTGPYFWQDNVGSTAFGSYPLWIADYGVSCPSLPPGWSHWTIWQYSDGGGHLDHDVFNGSSLALEDLAGGPIKGLDGKCVDARGGDAANGTPIQLYDCNGSEAQMWRVDGNGSLSALGKCMDATRSGTADGTLIQLYTCNGTGAQVWKHQADGTLLNPESGKCLDVTGFHTANGTRLELWNCKTTNDGNQVWHLP